MQSKTRHISIDVCDYTDKPLCNLYDSANQISGQAVNVVVHTERNGYKEIKFSIPSTCMSENGLEENYRLKYLVSDYRIKLQVKENGTLIETDWFLISENKVVHNAFSKQYDISAKHISQLLTTKNLDLEFRDDEGNNVGTIRQLAELILEGTNWHLGEVAEFLEEEKYSEGQEVEKKRSFTAQAKTGAFKMMNDLCELFKAKAVYHGAGQYQTYIVEGRNPQHVVATYGAGYDQFEARKAISNAEDEGWTNLSAIEDVIATGRTVDILPLNPFSDKIEEGQIPSEVLRQKKVLELHYDKNIKSITRTLNSESLITKLSAYGASGDYTTGFCSLQTAVHKELTFNITLNANQEYAFIYLNSKYYFTPSETITNAKWSYLDFVSRSYIYYYKNSEFKICKVYKEPKTVYYTTISDSNWTTEDVTNQVPYIMDFSYYQKVGLLTDQMLYDLAVSQVTLPEKHVEAQKKSLELTETLDELMRTTSDGNGFARLSVIPQSNRDNCVVLGLDTDNYPDGVIYRSDYNESARRYFSWRPALGFKDNGEALSAIGSVVYAIKQGSGNTATKWVKAYLKAVGRGDYFYYRDDLETIYKITSEQHYDKKERLETDPLTVTEFPVVGQEGVVYFADKEFKKYVWNGEYVEAYACNYVYGMDKFEAPTKIMLWSSDETFFSSLDYVYLFSSDSLAGVFGPREDDMAENAEALLKARRLTTEACSLDFVYADHNQLYTEPSSAVAQQNYGWYYLIYPEIGSTNRLFFCWGKADESPDNAWKEVYISYGNENPETNPTIAATSNIYSYYYSIRRKMLYRANALENKWIAIKGTVDKDDLTAHFGDVVAGCQRQERLYKGLADVYSHSVTSTLPVGNYALKNEFNTYWIFTTNKTLSSGTIKYKVGDKMIWQTEDINDTVRCVERAFNVLSFPSANELEGVNFNVQTFDPINNIFTTGENNKISNNVEMYEKITYKCKLPANSYVVYFNTNGRVISKTYFQNSTLSTAGTFTTPAHTTHIRVVCEASVTSFDNCEIYVDGYSNKIFSNDVMYTVLNTTASNKRDGMSDLMDQFVSLSNEAFFVKLPALRRAQQQIKEINTNLMNELGDMYREGRWQNNDYVEKDEYKLYTDALDNLREVSHPEANYDISFIDLYKMQNYIGLSVDESSEDVDYPEIDISYAAHLIDPELDINCWAYIDMTDICYDKPKESKLEINTRLSMIGQQNFTDVLARIAEVANTVKANETIYKRASVLTGSGKLAAERLEGMINLNRLQILGGTSNWYTDAKGNIVFQASDGESAMMLTGRGWAISQEKDANGEWVWRYMATGKGLTADAIYTGYLSGERIEAGSITVDKISASLGQELDIGSNAALNLYATVDGTRPAGYLVTKHPDEGDSWISIGPKTESHEAYVDIKSGGLINIEAGSKLQVASRGSIQIDSGGDFLINSDNLTITKDNSGNYALMAKGQIIAESGNIAGYVVNGTKNQQGQYTKQWMYAGQTSSLDSTSAGVYIGTDGINIGGGKFKFSADGNTAVLKVNASDIFLGDVSNYSTLAAKLTGIDGNVQTAKNIADSKSRTFRTTRSAMRTQDYKLNDVFISTDATTVGSDSVYLYRQYVCYNVTELSTRNGYSDSNWLNTYFKNDWRLTGTAAVGGAALVMDSEAGTIDILANNAINIAANKQVSITTSGTIEIGHGAAPFIIGATTGTGKHAYITSDVDRKAYNTADANTSANCVYVGTDGISLGTKATTSNGTTTYSIPFKVDSAGNLNATSATISGNITATSGKIGNWYIESNSLCNASTLANSTVGMYPSSTATDVVFWAGNKTRSSANFRVYANGNVTLNALTATGADVKGTIKATSLYVGATSSSDGTQLKVLDGFAVTSATTDVGAAIKTKAGITVNSDTGVVISSASGDASKITDTMNKIAAITLSGTKIDPSSLTTAAANAITKAANISVTNGRIDLTSLSTSVVNSTGLSTTLANYAQLSVVPTKISALTFDTFGNTSKVQITPTKITVGSSGSVDFSAAGSVSFKAGSINFSAITGYTPPDISGKQDKVSGITINSSGVAISGSKYIKLDVTANTNYVHIDSNGIDVKGSSIKVNGKDVWNHDNIIISSTVPNTHPAHDWVLIKPYYDASINFSGTTGDANSNSNVTTYRYTKTGNAAFGNGSEWYEYSVHLSVSNLYMSVKTRTIAVFFANKPFSIDWQSSVSVRDQALSQCVTYTYSNTHEYGSSAGSAAGYVMDLTTGKLYGYPNLCGEGQDVYYCISGIEGFRVHENSLHATTSATTSKVPCTVYYYP